MARTSYLNVPGRLSVFAVTVPLLLGCVSSGFTVPFTGKTDTQTYPMPPSAANRSGSYSPAQTRQGSAERQVTKISKELKKAKGVGTYPGATTARKISTAFRRAANSLAPSPRVTPTNDPTRLATEHGPIGPGLFVSSARMFEHQGKIDNAMASYGKALEIDPDCRDALIGYARLEHRSGNLREAVELYRRAVENDPQDAMASNDLGLCLARLGEVEQGISMLAMAVQSKPASTRYRNNIATLLVEAGRTDEALAHLERAHGHAKAHHNLGYLLKQRGESELAMRYFARAIEVDPTLEASRAMLAQMSRQPQFSAGTWPPRQNATVHAPVSPAPSVRIGARSTRVAHRPASFEMDAPPEPLDVLPSGHGTGTAPSPQYVPQSRLRVGPFGYEPTDVEAN